jgi:hypothetical protein
MKHHFLAYASRALVLALLALAPAACKSDATAVCDMKCDCDRCSPGDYDSCLRNADADEAEADRRGCLSQYDDLKACQNDTGYCKSNGDFETSCGREKDRLDACMK